MYIKALKIKFTGLYLQRAPKVIKNAIGKEAAITTANNKMLVLSPSKSDKVIAKKSKYLNSSYIKKGISRQIII